MGFRWGEVVRLVYKNATFVVCVCMCAVQNVEAGIETPLHVKLTRTSQLAFVIVCWSDLYRTPNLLNKVSPRIRPCVVLSISYERCGINLNVLENGAEHGEGQRSGWPLGETRRVASSTRPNSFGSTLFTREY